MPTPRLLYQVTLTAELDITAHLTNDNGKVKWFALVPVDGQPDKRFAHEITDQNAQALLLAKWLAEHTPRT